MRLSYHYTNDVGYKLILTVKSIDELVYRFYDALQYFKNCNPPFKLDKITDEHQVQWRYWGEWYTLYGYWL